jgi:hypothetical protein
MSTVKQNISIHQQLLVLPHLLRSEFTMVKVTYVLYIDSIINQPTSLSISPFKLNSWCIRFQLITLTLDIDTTVMIWDTKDATIYK